MMTRIAAALFALAVTLAPLGAFAQSQQTLPALMTPGGPVMIGQTVATVDQNGTTAVVTVKPQHTVDVTPVTDELQPILLTMLSGIAVWAGKMLLTFLHLQNNAMARATVDQGMQKALGAATTILRQRLAGKTWTVDAHSAFLKEAGDFAVAHFPDALKAIGITFTKDGSLTEASRDKIDSMIEARLGMMSLDASKAMGKADPVVAAATDPHQDPVDLSPPKAGPIPAMNTMGLPDVNVAQQPTG